MTEDSILSVYFLDVGQGDCSFVIPPGEDECAVLFDCRDAYVAQRFVLDHGVTRLKVVVSHLDWDHIAGMQSFLQDFLDRGYKVEEIYLDLDRPLEALSITGKLLIEQVLNWWKEKRIPTAPQARGADPYGVMSGDGWRVDLVLPYHADRTDMVMRGGAEPNPSSVALRVECGETAILVGGDVPLISWEKLEPRFCQARVFRVPHHGGNIDDGAPSWTVETLYQAVSPEVAVISVGTGNGHGHPKPLHMQAVAAGRPCRRLCTQLTPRCHPDPIQLRDFRLAQGSSVCYPYRHRVHPEERRKYRPEREVPCAGSVVAMVDGSGGLNLEPEIGGRHEDFVQRVRLTKGTPMCCQNDIS